MGYDVDRAAGALLGLATGDALGAGYEFDRVRLGAHEEAEMIGTGGFAPGEWTDDTSMAVCIAEVTATGRLDLEAVAQGFLDWFDAGPTDVGISTAAVLRQARGAADLAASAARYFERNPQGGAGNGALMRTAPVALAHLGDDQALAGAARAVAELTHADPLAGDSCVLWCIAIDRAVREGRLDGVRDGLAMLPKERRERWAGHLVEAETAPLDEFHRNGFTVTALQAAYAAIARTRVPDDLPGRHLQDALHQAVRVGGDTDTVAAIAGSLLGARWGASAVPFRWKRMLHGWPGLRADDLVRLAILTARHGQADALGWPCAPVIEAPGDPPYLTPLPGDEGLLLGSLPALSDAIEAGVDAVVSLCRVGTDQVPSSVEHHQVWLVDQVNANPNLDFVLGDVADAIAALRNEGKRVFLHCVGGRSRTPTVAALYLARRDGIDGRTALARVAQAIPDHNPHNRNFSDALDRLAPDAGAAS